MVRRICVVLCLFVFACHASAAVTAFYDYESDHLWRNADNWLSGAVPADVIGDIAKIRVAQCIIDADTAAVYSSMYVGEGTYGASTITMTGGTLTSLTSTGSFGMSLGYSNDGTFNMSGGTFSQPNGTVRMGRTSGVTANLNVSGGTFSTGILSVGYVDNAYAKVTISGTSLLEIKRDYYTGLYFGNLGELEINGLGRLMWVGDRANDLNTYVAAGRIYTADPNRWPVATYDEVSDVTTLAVVDGGPAFLEAEGAIVAPVLAAIDPANNKYDTYADWTFDSGKSLVIYCTESLAEADVPKLVLRGLLPTTNYRVKAWIVYAPSDSVYTEYDWKLHYSFTSVAEACNLNGPFISNDSLDNPYKASFTIKSINRYSLGTATSDPNGHITLYMGRVNWGPSLDNSYIGWDIFEVVQSNNKAEEPLPKDKANFIDDTVVLKWTSAEQAASYNVYFGMDDDEVATAEPIDLDIINNGIIDIYDLMFFFEQWLCQAPMECSADFYNDGVVDFQDFGLLCQYWLEPVIYQGQIQVKSFSVSSLKPGTYYWRIDEVDSEDAVISKGDVWEFTVGKFIVTPEQYGAIGNGIVNDHNAIVAASAAIEEAGGGILQLTLGKTYRTGRQYHVDGETPYWQTEHSIEIKNAYVRKVVIDGNGATIKINDGLYFGAFHPDTGVPYSPPTDDSPYLYAVSSSNLIDVEHCSNVEIRNVNLDGNMDDLSLGGEWPNNETYGYCSAQGVYLISNDNAVLTDVNTFGNAMSGLVVNSPECRTRNGDDRDQPVYLKNVNSHHNGHLGLAWTGSFGVTAEDCKFNHTGRSRLWNAPAAGMDIEANSKTRRGRFIGCDFVDNKGFAVVSGSGPDNADVYFEDCLMFGTDNHTLAIGVPNFDFVDCNIYGQVYGGYGSSDVNEATQFVNCHIEDADNVIYDGEYYSTTFDMSGSGLIYIGQLAKRNITFDGCTIIANNAKALYITDPYELMVLENCNIYHKYNYPGNTFLSVLRGVYLKDVHFMEDLSDAYNYYIKADGNVIVDSNVVVDGTLCTWDVLGGQIGTIDPNTY
jgi:hypothetical protein